MSSNIFLTIAIVTTGIFAVQFILSIFLVISMQMLTSTQISAVWFLLRINSLWDRIRLVYVSAA